MVPSKECYVWNTCYGLAIEPINVFVNSRPVKNKQIEKVIHLLLINLLIHMKCLYFIPFKLFPTLF